MKDFFNTTENEASTHKFAIEVDKVSKLFKLPHEKHNSIKSLVVGVFRKRRKGYEMQKALNNISFDIKRGEFFGIVGRNGSGKSTLLKMLAGIYVPSKGTITVNGKLTPFIELGVGFNPELTGRENVFLNGALLGFNRKEMSELYHEIVEFAELERFMDQKLKNYSSGMQVRLAFSIAIQAKSDILLIDEVLAVGDALFQKKCFEYFAKLKEQKRTVVFVSHDADALVRFCDRGILIDNGKLLYSGSIQKTVNQYKDLLIAADTKAQIKETKSQKEKAKAAAKNKSGDESTEAPVEAPKIVKIKSVHVRNQNARTNEFEFGEDIYVETNLDVRQKIKSLNIAIGIYNGYYDAHADRVFGANTLLDKTKLKTESQKIILKVDSPPLRAGDYLVYVATFGESEQIPYDYAWEAVEFTVKGGPKLKSVGTTIADHEWKF